MFKIIALEVTRPINKEIVTTDRYKSIHKIMSYKVEDYDGVTPQKIFFFHNGYSFSADGMLQKNANTTEDTFYTNSGTRISFSAVVGENGMGKSTLLEMFFRLMNNISYVLQNGIKKSNSYKLLFVPDLYIRTYFEDIDGSFFTIEQFDNTILYSSQADRTLNWQLSWTNNRVQYVGDGDTQRAQQRLSRLFYTVVVNYASYAYNTADYYNEWDFNHFETDNRTAEERCWLSALFHKNDSYQTPIVLNPYRESGNVDYNNERTLTQERLFKLVLDNQSPLTRVLHRKDAKAIILDLNRDYYPQMRRQNHYDSKRVLNIARELKLLQAKAYGRELTEISHSILGEWSRCIGFNIIGDDSKQFWESIENERLCAINYLVYKTLKIIYTYPSFYKYKETINNSVRAERNAALRKAVADIYTHESHITLKIRRCVAYLIFEHYTSRQILRGDDKIFGRIMPIDYLTNEMENCINREDAYIRKNQDKYGALIKRSYAKKKPIKWTRDTLMPASFYYTDLLLKDDQGNEVGFNSLSSGEKQMIHSISAILYQIGNIESVWKSKDKNQARYEKICLVFDEIELYFHPKYQTKLVAFLIETLQGLHLEHIKDIQIILSTHSPFILSDLPSSDLLRVKDGSPSYDGMGQTFGANVYDILNNSFFMEQSIGEFAQEKLKNLIKKINRYNETQDARQKDSLLHEIEQYGDDYLKMKLRKALGI